MDFTTEVWDPVLLASAQGNGHGHGASHSHSRSTTSATNTQQQQSASSASGASQSHAEQPFPTQSASATQAAATHLAVPSTQPAAQNSSQTQTRSQPVPTPLPPTSPSLVPKRTNMIYRIFHLGDASPPEHLDELENEKSAAPGQPSNAAIAKSFFWGKSRKQGLSGSDFESDDDISDDSSSCSGGSAAAAHLGHRASLSNGSSSTTTSSANLNGAAAGSSSGSNATTLPRARKASISDAVDMFRRASITSRPRSNSNNSINQQHSNASNSQPSQASQNSHHHHSHHKKGIFSIGSEDDSSDYESDFEEAAPKKPARSNLFKDLLTGTRTKKTPAASSPRYGSPGMHASHHSASASAEHLSRDDVMSPLHLDADAHHGASSHQRQESHSIFKDLLAPRSKRAPSISSGSGGSPQTGTSSRSTQNLSTPTTSQMQSPSSISGVPATMTQSRESDMNSPAMQSPAQDSTNEMAPPPMAHQSSQDSMYLHPTLDRRPSHASLPRSKSSDVSLNEKYGKPEDVLGRGAYATVKLCCPLNSSQKYAIKEFRKRRKDESQKEYVKKLVSEFCISSSMEHDNIVRTVDLIRDAKSNWCVVMEYCAGGDLFTRISNGSLKGYDEMACYFKQLVCGVRYLHSMGVSHRDLKPENLLLDASGRIVKITDFGVSQVFRVPFATVCKKTHGVAGSGPYIAPEEFDRDEYDSEAVDVWSIGIIYYVMATNSIPWKTAIPTDQRYKYYLEHQNSFAPIEKLQPGPRKLLYRILDPNPDLRICIPDILMDDWCKDVEMCTQSNANTIHHKHESHSHK